MARWFIAAPIVLVGAGGGLAVLRRLRRVDNRCDELDGRLADDITAGTRANRSVNAPPICNALPAPPPQKMSQRKRWISLEALVMLGLAAVFGIAGWVVRPDEAMPQKFSVQHLNIGISDIPLFFTVSEYHGPTPDHYSDIYRIGPASLAGYQKVADPALTTVDIDAANKDLYGANMPTALFVDIPKDAQLDACQGWSDAIQADTALPNPFNPNFRKLASIDCRLETEDEFNRTMFFTYAPFVAEDYKDVNRLRITTEIPKGQASFFLHLVFRHTKGIGFSSSPSRIEIRQPQLIWFDPRDPSSGPLPLVGPPTVELRDAFLHSRYYIANADQASWTGTPPRATDDEAEWNFKGLEAPPAATGTWDDVVQRDSDQNFTAGVLLGIFGAALIAAAQAIFSHQRTYRTLLAAADRDATTGLDSNAPIPPYSVVSQVPE